MRIICTTTKGDLLLVELEGDLALAHDRLPAPAAVLLVPLIGIDDAFDLVFDGRERDLPAERVDSDQIEPGVGSLLGIAALEDRPDADIGIARAQRQRLVVLGGTAVARLEHAHLY
mgnify:CR=1 FL=1